MCRYIRYFLIFFFFSLVLFTFVKPVVAEESEILIEYFYGDRCETCKEETTPVVNQIENYYKENITILRYPCEKDLYPENYEKMKSYDLVYPAVVVKNLTADKFNTFSYSEISYENINNSIIYHLEGNYSKEAPKAEKYKTYCLLGLCFNVSELSLPVLTFTMAILDSFNPCAFFILIFLLNLLLYVRSRRRMLLIGGIFIFFSAFIYFLLMTAILNVYLLIDQITVIKIFAGVVAITFGILNIKDFVIFKQGPSLSISEDKKANIIQRMRNIIRTPQIPALIVGTIVFAIFVNTYELLCSLGFPLVYVSQLTSHNLSSFQYYSYLIIYNIIYVIPLLVILFIFVIFLGKVKLTEWQGRLLKLMSGIMMFSLGIVMLLIPDILKDVVGAVGIILFSLLSTFIISLIWKNVLKK